MLGRINYSQGSRRMMTDVSTTFSPNRFKERKKGGAKAESIVNMFATRSEEEDTGCSGGADFLR